MEIFIGKAYYAYTPTGTWDCKEVGAHTNIYGLQ